MEAFYYASAVQIIIYLFASTMYLHFSAASKLNYLASLRAANWGSFKMRVAYIKYILITVFYIRNSKGGSVNQREWIFHHSDH